MAGIQQNAARDLFELLRASGGPSQEPPALQVLVSFFEIYGGRCQDLLNDRERLLIREDGKGDVVIGGLQELEAQTEDDLLGFIEEVRLVCVGALI